MDNTRSPWVCKACGYRLRGLSDDSQCPECGSSESVLDLDQVYHVSNVKYACAFMSLACFVFAITLVGSVLGHKPEYYGLSSWWLLLGWLSGAVVYCVGVSTLSGSLLGACGSYKLPIRMTYCIWFAGVGSALTLFKATYDPSLIRTELDTLKLGIICSPLIALSTSSLPVLLSVHFRAVGRAKVSRMLICVALTMLFSVSVIIGLYLLIWLDWTVGINLYLSQPTGYSSTLTYALKICAILGACTSLLGVVVGIHSYRAVE